MQVRFPLRNAFDFRRVQAVKLVLGFPFLCEQQFEEQKRAPVSGVTLVTELAFDIAKHPPSQGLQMFLYLPRTLELFGLRVSRVLRKGVFHRSGRGLAQL